MNKEELSRYFYIKKDIERINNKIKEIDDTFISASRLNGMRYEKHLSNPQETRMMLIEKYQNILDEKLNEALEELIKIETYIKSIEDYDIRMILSYRFIDLMEWKEIAKKLFMGERTVYRKYSEFINS